MNIELKLVGELNDATMVSVLNVLTGAEAPAAKQAAKAPAAKKQAEPADDTEEEEPTKTAKSAAPAKKAPAAAPKQAAKAPAKPAAKATVSDEDKVEALEAQDEEDQLATIQAEITKHTKKGKTADIKKLLAIYGAPKASELDPSTYSEFYGLVLRFAGGEAADDIVESFEV